LDKSASIGSLREKSDTQKCITSAARTRERHVLEVLILAIGIIADASSLEWAQWSVGIDLVAVSQGFVTARNKFEIVGVESKISESSQRALVGLEVFGRRSRLVKKVNKRGNHVTTASSHLVALHFAGV
jgi:hypothetical protein